ncbi:preprotein translocase subunit SecE [Lachnospiraceae bacterium oral taxon 500]|nr:preprotein translocase subunit SecE [Lachnospiraceae bacterium oral taxon 500]
MGWAGGQEMSETPKIGFFKEMKGEFGKIVWPSRQTTVKSVLTVLGVTAILGAILAGLDAGFQYLILNLLLGK